MYMALDKSTALFNPLAVIVKSLTGRPHSINEFTFIENENYYHKNNTEIILSANSMPIYVNLTFHELSYFFTIERHTHHCLNSGNIPQTEGGQIHLKFVTVL